jgi:type 1 glutamine amidotransferase
MNRHRRHHRCRRHHLFALLSALLCVLAAGAAGGAPPIRVLLLSGSNNHNWRQTTPELRSILDESARFQTTVTEDVPRLAAADFARADVILSNFNTFGKTQKPADETWAAPVRRAFLEHIRSGAGFVVVHAGSSGFYDWPEFQQLAITSWTLGKTRHGRRHTAPVRLDRTHPLTDAIPDFFTHDEFWENLDITPGARPLAWATPSPDFGGGGREAPVLFVQNYGRGRVVTHLLGHDLAAQRNPAFRLLLRRAVEWAATGEVTQPATPVPTTPAEAAACLPAKTR